MKKILSIIFLMCACSAMAQTSVQAPVQKSITVTGTSEMEIVPDEIYFRVVLKEYLKDKTKMPLDKLEKELSQAVLACGVKQEDFMVERVYGQRWSQKKYKDAELYSSKSYIIKVSDPAKIDEILDKVNPESIESVNIRNFSHSKIEEYKRQLKIEAIKAAKVKATYLLEAIGEKIGEALEINEYDRQEAVVWDLNPVYAQSRISNNAYNSENGFDTSGIGFQKIKLQFQVTAKFAIK